jgi:uncharacterized protein (DUF2062 family)
LQYWYWRLLRLQGRPEKLARGLACGVFAGVFPFFGLQTVIGVVLAILFRGNKILAAAGTWISNPLTSVPIYAFNFHIGQLLLNDNSLTDISLQSWQEVKELGSEIILPLTVGCLAVGVVCAICSYFWVCGWFAVFGLRSNCAIGGSAYTSGILKAYNSQHCLRFNIP